MLLVSDFDGTLTGSAGRIPAENLSKIRYFNENGGRFTISTGRTKAGFHNYSNEIINAPVLLGNGGMAFDYEKGIATFVNAVSSSAVPVMLRILDAFPFLGTEIYTVDDRVCVINPHEKNIRHFSGLRIEEYSVRDCLDSSFFPAVKIMLYAGEKSKEVQDFLRSIDLGELKFIPCNGEFIEILSVEAGKGKAMYQLAAALGVDSTRVFAVGDGSNDTDMLSAAVIGFVPESGDALAKQAGDIIVCNSDGGCVAEVIDILERNFKI